MTPQEVEALIRQTAQESGAGDLADVLVAIGINETGLSPTTPGDYVNGTPTSFGVFHENDGGRGKGLTRAQREDVPAATRRLIAEYRAIAAKPENRGKDLGTLAVLTQRPAETHRPGYIQRVNAYMAGKGKGTTPTTGTNGTASGGRGGLPVAILLTDENGKPVPGAAGTPSGGTPGAAASAGGAVWPVAGGTVSNPFGGPQARAQGMSGPLPSSNVGLDISAPEGTAVRTPVRGTVVRVYQSEGGRNTGENHGYGGMVLLRGDDGHFHRLSHLQGGSVSVKAGDQVAAGQPVGKVGSTGNTRGAGGGPATILDWERFQTASGNPDDRNTMSFTDPSRAGTAAGTAGTTVRTTGGTRTVAVLQPADIPQEQVDRDPDVVDRQKRKAAQDAKVARFLADYNKAGQDLQALRVKYAGPDGQPRPQGPLTPAGQLSIDVRLRPKDGKPKIAGWDKIPGYWEDNPEWIRDKAAWTAATNTYNDLDDRSEGKGKEWSEAEGLAKTFDSDYLKAQQDARERLARESKDAAEGERVIIDSASGTILTPDGTPIGTLPRDAKPGSTFSVPGVGTFLLKPDGTAELIPGTKPVDTPTPGQGQRTVDTFDANGRPVTQLIGPDGRVIGTYPRAPGAGEKPNVRTVDTVDAQGRPVTQLIDDATGKVIQTYPKSPGKPTQLTAPKDTRYIVSQDEQGNTTVRDNPNYDPNAGATIGESSTGKVYRVTPDGKVSLTDTLTPEERALYEKGKQADLEGKQAGTWKTQVDALKAWYELELKRYEQDVWDTQVQPLLSDPNASPEAITTAIMAGARNAEQAVAVMRAHVERRAQEEIARSNKVTEGINIQNADARAREGLYRDINEVRQQRTLAQGAANEAIRDSGIIGEANSMNVLSAMAPQVGSEGIRRAGTIGLGVGAGAIGPVQKTWEEHQAELQRLQAQMPSIRLANPDVATPSFGVPRPSGPMPNRPAAPKMPSLPPFPGAPGAGKPGDKVTDVGGATAGTNGVPPPPAAAPGRWGTAGPEPTEAGDPAAVGGSFNVTPGGAGGVMHPALPPAEPPPGTIGWLEAHPEEQEAGGGGYAPHPRFKAPRPRPVKKKAA